MELFNIRDLNDLPKLEPNTCVIGSFDGLHIGHQELIKKAKGLGLKTLLITFDNQRKTNYYLMTTGQKHQLMSNYGVDYLIVFPYELIKNISYVDFIKMLESFNVKNIICGDDFRFGYNREGTVYNLKEHFNIFVSEYTLFGDERASSSIIKELISSGDFFKASKFLGRNYAIIGNVLKSDVDSNKTILDIDYKGYLLPPDGKYDVIVKYNNKEYNCVLEIFNVSPSIKKFYLKIDAVLNNVVNTNIEIFFN